MEKNGSFSKKESELIGLSRNVLIHRRKSSFLRSTAFDRTSNSCSVSYKARAWNEAVSICRQDSAGSKIAWARLKNLSSLRISYENEWDESNIYNNTLTYHVVQYFVIINNINLKISLVVFSFIFPLTLYSKYYVIFMNYQTNSVSYAIAIILTFNRHWIFFLILFIFEVFAWIIGFSKWAGKLSSWL